MGQPVIGLARDRLLILLQRRRAPEMDIRSAREIAHRVAQWIGEWRGLGLVLLGDRQVRFRIAGPALAAQRHAERVVRRAVSRESRASFGVALDGAGYIVLGLGRAPEAVPRGGVAIVRLDEP